MSAAIQFTTPPPGFEPIVDFSLDEVAGAAGLFTLRPAGADIPRVFLLDAATYLPDYRPELADRYSEELELVSGVDALVLVVANPDEGTTTVNLLAPIVVNTRTGRCAQVILDDREWPLRTELVVA